MIMILSAIFLAQSVLAVPPNLSHYTDRDVSRVLLRVANNQTRGDRLNVSFAVRVVSSPIPNAWINEQRDEVSSVLFVSITTSMLKLLKTEDSLAVILGHEWSHYLNGDTAGNWKPVYSEIRADISGVGLAKLAGYDVCYAADVYKELIAKYGPTPPETGSTHPTHESRVAYLSCTKDMSSQAKDVLLGGYQDARSALLAAQEQVNQLINFVLKAL